MIALLYNRVVFVALVSPVLTTILANIPGGGSSKYDDNAGDVEDWIDIKVLEIIEMLSKELFKGHYYRITRITH